ncbi:MAG: hypothetical protein QW776_02940 [Candidatus Nitrosocaldus sp.]
MNIYNRITIKKGRINEVSNFLEKELPNIFNIVRDRLKVVRNVGHLGGAGYPDVRVDYDHNKVVYLDIKATTRPDTASTRDFYFTPLGETKRKVTLSAKHAVLGFVVDGKPNMFKIIGWKLSDLSKIRVGTKPEFNADNLEIYKKEAILNENHV